MELAVGQYTRRGPIGALDKLCPILKGAGVGTVFISFFLCTYYNVILAWAMLYLTSSFQSPLPWSHCNNGCVKLTILNNFSALKRCFNDNIHFTLGGIPNSASTVIRVKQ